MRDQCLARDITYYVYVISSISIVCNFLIVREHMLTPELYRQQLDGSRLLNLINLITKLVQAEWITTA